MKQLLSFTFFVALVVLLFALCLPLTLLPEGLRWRMGTKMLSLISKALLRVMRVSSSEQRDSENPSATAKIIVANHVSYIDIALLASRRPCVFLGKAEIGRWPLIGSIARATGMILVERENLGSRARALLTLQQRLQEGFTVVIFPEGTTSLTGPAKGLSPFFGGAFRLARMEELSVEWVYLDYENLPLCAWLGDEDFLGHLWNFMGEEGPHRVTLRSEVQAPISTRREQRAQAQDCRRWLTEGGRNICFFLRRSKATLNSRLEWL